MGKRGNFKLCCVLLWGLAVVRGSEGSGFGPYVVDPSGPGGPPPPFGGPSGPGFGGPPGPPPPPFYGGPPIFGGPGPFNSFGGGFRPFGPSRFPPFQLPQPGFPFHVFGQQPYIGQFPVVDPVKSGFGSSYISPKVPSPSYGPVATVGAANYAQPGGTAQLYNGLQVVDPAKSTLFNSYLYQVNGPNFNGIQNSVTDQQQQQQPQQQFQDQPLAIGQNGAALPISYGETFQDEQVVPQPYQQAAPSVAPAAEYAVPSVAPPQSSNVAAAAAPLDIQSSYSTYQAPLTNYVYQFSKKPYKFPSGGDGGSSKDVAVSAPSNEDMIVAPPPGVLVPPPKKTDALNDEAAEVVVEMTPAASPVVYDETSTSKAYLETTTTLAPLQLTMKERIKGRKKVPLGDGKFMYGQRLSRGRSRSPFKNVELEIVDSSSNRESSDPSAV